MKPWPLVGSGAERYGAAGLLGLAAGGRRLGTAGPWSLVRGDESDAPRRVGRAAQSADPRSASNCRVPASTLPSTSIVGATPERIRPHERSDGGS
jgi:hypothetical protein